MGHLAARRYSRHGFRAGRRRQAGIPRPRRSRNGRYALNYTAFNYPAAIAFLLRAGAAIEAENHTGFTALHHAAENGSLEAARELLAAGADPEHVNGRGDLPVETAEERGHQEIVELLEAAEKSESP